MYGWRVDGSLIINLAGARAFCHPRRATILAAADPWPLDGKA
jgi:hypothetical protein